MHSRFLPTGFQAKISQSEKYEARQTTSSQPQITPASHLMRPQLGSFPDPNIPGNVLICHDTTSGPITLSLPPAMLDRYQNAGDYDGRCANNNSSTYCPAGSAPDCAGVCNGKSIQDCAGICFNPETTPTPHLRDCAGECYDVTCGPKHVPDCNGVCGGNSFKDCDGVCGGTSTPDCNGVCGGHSYVTCDGKCIDDECRKVRSQGEENRNGQVSKYLAKSKGRRR